MDTPPFLDSPDQTHAAVLALARSLKAARKANDAEGARNLEEVIGELNARYQRAVARHCKTEPAC